MVLVIFLSQDEIWRKPFQHGAVSDGLQAFAYWISRDSNPIPIARPWKLSRFSDAWFSAVDNVHFSFSSRWHVKYVPGREKYGSKMNTAGDTFKTVAKTKRKRVPAVNAEIKTTRKHTTIRKLKTTSTVLWCLCTGSSFVSPGVSFFVSK